MADALMLRVHADHDARVSYGVYWNNVLIGTIHDYDTPICEHRVVFYTHDPDLIGQDLGADTMTDMVRMLWERLTK